MRVWKQSKKVRLINSNEVNELEKKNNDRIIDVKKT